MNRFLARALFALAAAAALPAEAAPGPASSTVTPAVAALKRGFDAYRAGEYHAAAHVLAGALGKGLRSEDWALYLLAESEFYDGSYRSARTRFEKLSHTRTGRPAEMAPFRVADCLWMEGDRTAATAMYARLERKATPAVADPALVRFRLAESAEQAGDREKARKSFLAIARDFPAHPLADEALRRVERQGGTAGPTPAREPSGVPPSSLSPEDRLRRAESLSKDRHWDEALAELARLPPALAPGQAAERDYQIGMTKFHMRRDYAAAGELLLAAVPNLSGEKAASAQFHGARALSRVDRDDEAIAGYRKVVTQFPGSRYAAEAQYLSGWLDYNRGRFRESIPALQATLDHFGRSAFADDAAWCLAFAHFLLGDVAEAAAGLNRYGRLPATGIASDEVAARVAYWRARLDDKSGRHDQAVAGYRAIADRSPLSFYGLLSRARLREAGVEAPVRLPVKKVAFSAPTHPGRDPVVARAEELIAADMTNEAADEIERAEKDVLRRAGGAPAVGWLLDLYRRAGDFHRAFRLAEAHAGGALSADPRGDAGTRRVWEAAFPRAYEPLVDRYGPPAGNPDLLLYTIMHKESGFDPHDVSYADARGLLQMIPPTSARVAAAAGESFYPDQLYEPASNIRLGAIYIGSLYGKFGHEVPLTAGAYNAGPRAMSRWCQQHGEHPTDELVELIAFAQTREYVKRVTSLYAKYRYLYGPTPYEIPLRLDTKVAPTGPDY